MTKAGDKGNDIRAEAIGIVGQIPSGTKMLVQVEERMADGTRLRRPVTLIQEVDGWKVTVTDLGAGVVGSRPRNGRCGFMPKTFHKTPGRTAADQGLEYSALPCCPPG